MPFERQRTLWDADGNVQTTLSRPPDATHQENKATQVTADDLRPRLIALLQQANSPVELGDVRTKLGHPAPYMDENPLANPVNRLVKEMRDAGQLVVTERDFGDPLVSLTEQPDTSVAANVVTEESPPAGSWEHDVRQRFENHFVQPLMAELEQHPWRTAEALGNRAFGRMQIDNPIRTAVDILREQRVAGTVQIAWDSDGMPHYALSGIPLRDGLATEQQIEHAGGAFPVPPPLVRPDRQQVFDDPPEHWPKPKHDDESITVDRPHGGIDGPPHRFRICCRDHVEVLLSADASADRACIGTVTEIDHIRHCVLVAFASEEPDENWFPVELVFPTTDAPAVPANAAPERPPVAERGRADPTRDSQARGVSNSNSSAREFPTFFQHRNRSFPGCWN